ncbi:MAG TPA: LTA synthase family protein [Candidatus Acidoferrales bacterium]|nr:LTA synthase family protein [Candidatus Acidoferrales bacterium]
MKLSLPIERPAARLVLGALFGFSLAVSLAHHFLVDFFGDRRGLATVIIVLGTAGTAGFSWLLKRTRWHSDTTSSRAHGFLLALSAALGVLFAIVSPDRTPSVVWIKAAGDFPNQQAPVTDRSAWGEQYPAIELHASDGNDSGWMWRAQARLPKDIQALGGRVEFLVTQPEWSVFDPEKRVYQGGDGVDVNFLIVRGRRLEPAGSVHLNLHRRPEQRLWELAAVGVPAGSEQLIVEALPGPKGSNNWHDRVFVSVKWMRSDLAGIGRIADAILVAAGIYMLGSAAGVAARWVPSPAAVPLAKILSVAAVLWLFLLGVRATDALTEDQANSHAFSLLGLILSGYYDLLYVGALTAAFAALACFFHRRGKAQRMLYRVFAAIAAGSLSVGILNVKISRVLGVPFNYQWLYYSDFLSGQTARTAVFSYVSMSALALLLAANMAFLIAAFALSRKLGRQARAGLGPAVAAGLPLLAGFCLVAAARSGGGSDYEKTRLANPVVSFLESVVASATGPKLFTMEASAAAEDFQPAARSLPEAGSASSERARIRNVIFFVLESVAAEYIYGGDPVTSRAVPEIRRYQNHSASFGAVYAHAPASNKSLVSLLCSVYPLISYKSLTQENPEAPLSCLSNELRRRGFRTGFFSSGDARFQRGHEFLEHQRFDAAVSYRDLKCAKKSFAHSTAAWPFQDHHADECILDPFAQWADQDRGRPFFAVLWPVQTHHPYSVVGTQENFGVAREDFNRYLNALREVDQLFGRLMKWLEARSLSEDTLVVLVGDHGEAFGQHGQWIHASHI